MLSESQDDGAPEGNIKAVQPLHSGAIIIELDSKNLANWLRSPAGRQSLEDKLGPLVSLRERTFGIVLQYLPISLKIDHDEFLRKCEEENTLPARSLHSIHWIKPPQRRTKEQQRAFALLQVADVGTANDILKEGLCIQSNRITVQKDKKEPIRCVKCQRFGHIARNCRNPADTCGTCGNSHRTAECNAYRTERCINCKNTHHTSWSRACPEFKRQCDIIDAKYPENHMPFFPTELPWTQAIHPPKSPETRHHKLPYADSNLELAITIPSSSLSPPFPTFTTNAHPPLIPASSAIRLGNRKHHDRRASHPKLI